MNSPGHRPSGVLDNEHLGCFCWSPYSPPGSPGQLPNLGSMPAMTPGSDFLAIQKIIKKSSPQKSSLFRFWAHFGAPLASFWAILGSQKAPKGDMFTYFFRCIFGPGFWSMFSLKNEKSKKWKSVFRPVNIDRLWGSPCPKKCKDVSKKSNEKNNVFSVENRWKIDEKVGCSTLLSRNR